MAATQRVIGYQIYSRVANRQGGHVERKNILNIAVDSLTSFKCCCCCCGPVIRVVANGVSWQKMYSVLNILKAIDDRVTDTTRKAQLNS